MVTLHVSMQLQIRQLAETTLYCCDTRVKATHRILDISTIYTRIHHHSVISVSEVASYLINNIEMVQRVEEQPDRSNKNMVQQLVHGVYIV